MSLPLKILIGLLLGLIGGISYSVLQPENLTLLPFIEPIGTLWVNAIRMTIIPLLMALLVTAIAGQAGGSNLARLGGKTILFFLGFIGLSCAVALFIAAPLIAQLQLDPEASQALLARTSGSPADASELPPFRDWLVSLIPTNPFAAAADGAVLPLLLFTVLFAVALHSISASQRQLLVDFFFAIKEAMFVLIAWLMALAPVGVFALVFPLAATLGLSLLSLLATFVAIVCSLLLLLALLLYPIAIFGAAVPLRQFARLALPVQAIGFSTRSSLAALPATVAASAALGARERVSGVVLPMAVSLFKYASPLARSAGTFFVAVLYGIELGFMESLIVVLAIGLLSFYSPGIPSGGLLIMAPVYLSLGLPVEGIGLLIAIDLVVDMFITAANVTANLTLTLLLTRLDGAAESPVTNS